MDRVSPEKTSSWIQHSPKSTLIKQTWHNFVQNATLHGLLYVFSSPSTFRRILWTVLLLSGVGYFSYQTSGLLKKYFSYPIITKVTLVYEKDAEFPAVTICSFNMVRKTYAENNSLEKVVTLSLMGSKLGTILNNSEIDWSSFENVNVNDLYRFGGHQIEDMILECFWVGEDCSHRNFTPILTSMGLCHTFNSGKIFICI